MKFTTEAICNCENYYVAASNFVKTMPEYGTLCNPMEPIEAYLKESSSKYDSKTKKTKFDSIRTCYKKLLFSTSKEDVVSWDVSLATAAISAICAVDRKGEIKELSNTDFTLSNDQYRISSIRCALAIAIHLPHLGKIVYRNLPALLKLYDALERVKSTLTKYLDEDLVKSGNEYIDEVRKRKEALIEEVKNQLKEI